MFLDDELYEMISNTTDYTPKGIVELHSTIMKKCESYFKERITFNTPEKEVKAHIDRAFKLYDSFVTKALKSNNYKTVILGEMFRDHHFKTILLNNEGFAKAYKSL